MVNLVEILKQVTDDIQKELEDTQLRVEGAQIGAIRMFEAVKAAITANREEKENVQECDRSCEEAAPEPAEVVPES